MSNATKIFLVVLFSLAAVGLVLQLQTNPLTVVLSIGFAILIFYGINRVSGSKTGGSEKGYQKALKQQKKRDKLSASEVHKLTRLKRTSGNVPFKVINGSKGNKGRSTKPKEKKSNFH